MEPASASRPRTVLVVDDVSVDRKLLSRCLERDGYQVSMAYDGRQALQLLRAQHEIDLVLIDVQMPVMNGFETLSRIKSTPELWHIPVILMSSDDKAEDGVSSALMRSISLGAADFLHKPINQALLRSKLSDVFTSKTRVEQKAITVLCIDDQLVVRKTVQKCLTRAGFSVELAEDGAQALELLQARYAPGSCLPPIDIILLDLFMPRMNGRELLVILKASSEWANIPVIIMTSDDEADTMDTMLGLGADDCLKKPLGDGLLKKRISKALESNRLRAWVAKLWPAHQQAAASGCNGDISVPRSPSLSLSTPSFAESFPSSVTLEDPSTAAAGDGGEIIIAKNPTPPTADEMLVKPQPLRAPPSASVPSPATGTPPVNPGDVILSQRDFEMYERAKADNRDLKRRLKEKHTKISSLEAILMDLSRTLESERSNSAMLQRQLQSVVTKEREARLLLSQSEQRVHALVKEAASRGYIPCLLTPKSIPPSLVSEELQEVYGRADALFAACPDSQMSLHREELATLTHDVCGYPTYFARPLFERILLMSSRTGRRDADMSAGFAAGELDVITLDDFMRYWQELVETGLSDHIGKFWFLVRRPGSDSLQPEDLRPVIKSLVDYHVDLSAFRTDSDLLEAYITTVLIGIFCSLHGQGISKISLGELKGSNLVDAFDLVSSQSTRNIRPFCVAYFDEIISRFRSLDRSGTGVVRFDDIAGTRNVKITRFMLQRVFGQYPRRLTCGILGCMNYTDFVWFWLAEKDGMVDTSLTYWFRCLDIDNDGFLSVHDLLTAYNMKITAMMEAGMSVTPLLSPFDVMCQIMDAINPKEPGMISCLDLKRSNNASILFDVFVCMASTGPASISPSTED